MGKKRQRLVSADDDTLTLVKNTLTEKVRGFEVAVHKNRENRRIGEISETLVKIGLGETAVSQEIEDAWIENANKLRDVIRQL